MSRAAAWPAVYCYSPIEFCSPLLPTLSMHFQSTKFKGVMWDDNQAKWRAQLPEGGKRSVLGFYDGPEEAAEVNAVSILCLCLCLGCIVFWGRVNSHQPTHN